MDIKFTRESRKKVEAGYKTLYITNDLADRVTDIATENETSFNNVVISFIEACLAEIDRGKNAT